MRRKPRQSNSEDYRKKRSSIVSYYKRCCIRQKLKVAGVRARLKRNREESLSSDEKKGECKRSRSHSRQARITEKVISEQPVRSIIRQRCFAPQPTYSFLLRG